MRGRSSRSLPRCGHDRAPSAGATDPTAIRSCPPLPSGKDLDKAAEARAKQEESAAEELWIDGPPTLDDGTEEHFEPPPPPPVPRPTRNTVLAVLLIALGIVFMAFPRLVGLDDGAGLTLGVLAILGGAALLILRLRETRADDGPDDGAIV